MARKNLAVVTHPAAVRDIIEIADYLAQSTSVATAHRFAASMEATVTRLARMPGTGSPWHSEHPRLAGVRFAPVTRFRNHLVFYRPVEDGIEVLRVLHGARNIESLLTGDE
jgi:toxin ParE1/3/4